MTKEKFFSIIIFASTFLTIYPQVKIDNARIFKTQINNLSSAEKDKLNECFVIIRGDLIFVETEKIEGLELANVIINEKLIRDSEERFMISHLIRNVMIDGAIIKNLGDNENELVLSPYIEIDKAYIIKHKKNIIKVLYYLCHRNYFNLYGKLQSSGEKIFTSPLLEPIEKDVVKLKRKLQKENGLEIVTDLFYKLQ